MNKYTEYILEQAENLLAIDSPSGFTQAVTDYLMKEYKDLGYAPAKTTKGGVLVDLGGKGNGLLLTAHVDTLGGMTAQIKQNGRLRMTPVGGMNPNNAETENCRIYTFDGREYTGTLQLQNASIHVNKDFNDKSRSFDEMEILIDEPV